ncbi:E3 ubiquitin-protein ligase ZSWIM2 [Clarias gariepinus]
MFRKRVWRKAASEAVKRHQDESLNTTMFLLKEFGPTGFLLQEEGEPKHYKVFLGDLHTCTCGTFHKEQDLCKHLCWVLMRKFRLPRDHEYCFQAGLVERQILEVLQHPYRTDSVPSAPAQVCSSEEGDDMMRQKDIRDDDICPICQEELLRKRLPVAHCRFGCGNNVHVSCMRLWADHQTGSETAGMVKCPLCRENFSTMKMLQELVKNASRLCTSSERERLEKHLGIPCNSCRICPVVGKCFKCTLCSHYHLCEDCFRTSSHPQHSFAVRMKRNQSWQLTEESKTSSTDTDAVVKAHVNSDVVPEHVLKSFPFMQVHRSSRLLEPGIQCRLCLQSFHVGQQGKTLPCRHTFHSGCIKTWLQHSVCCPVDWHVIYNPLTWSGNDSKVTSTAPPIGGAQKKIANQQNFELFGVGLQRKERSDVPQRRETGPKTSFPSLSSSPVAGTQQGLFLRFSKHDIKARRESSSLHGWIRPVGLKGDATGVQTRRSSCGGHQSDPDLQPRIFQISANRERKD